MCNSESIAAQRLTGPFSASPPYSLETASLHQQYLSMGKFSICTTSSSTPIASPLPSTQSESDAEGKMADRLWSHIILVIRVRERR